MRALYFLAAVLAVCSHAAAQEPPATAQFAMFQHYCADPNGSTDKLSDLAKAEGWMAAPKFLVPLTLESQGVSDPRTFLKTDEKSMTILLAGAAANGMFICAIASVPSDASLPSDAANWAKLAPTSPQSGMTAYLYTLRDGKPVAANAADMRKGLPATVLMVGEMDGPNGMKMSMVMAAMTPGKAAPK